MKYSEKKIEQKEEANDRLLPRKLLGQLKKKSTSEAQPDTDFHHQHATNYPDHLKRKNE